MWKKDTYPDVATKMCYNCSSTMFLKTDRTGCVADCNSELGSYMDISNKACINCQVLTPITKSNGIACVANCLEDLGIWTTIF